MADPVDEAAGRLYGVPLEDFVTERNAAAREIRKADREAAEAIGRLPKPAPQAWAANRVAREQPDVRDELLAAGEALREAQEAAVAGRGRDALREATARERAAVDAFLDAAAGQRPSGRALSAAARERLRSTLRAAAADEEVAAALAAGRLVADAEAGGAWPLGGVPAGDAKPRTKPKARGKEKPAGDRAAERRREEERKREEEERRREQERRRELRAQLDDARRQRRARERELERAEREDERARDAAREAAERLQAAREAADHARDAVARLEEQLD